MQIRSVNFDFEDYGMILWITEGGSDAAVTRTGCGVYICHRQPCMYKNLESCEHTIFAKQYYDEVLNPSIELRQQRERQKLQDEIEKAKSKLKLLEAELGVETQPEEPSVLESGYKRRIVV